MRINKDIDIESLNKAYSSLSPLERLHRFYLDFGDKDILLSSSFGTTSAYLLHLVRQANKDQTVYFINTGYLFKETLDYVKLLQKRLDLKIKTVHPEFHHHQYTTQNKTWVKDPNLCCSVNKVLPFEEFKKKHHFWISGLIATQSKSRGKRQIFEEAGDIVKFHPILDVELDDVNDYFVANKLPKNPLLKKGYGSVGCFYCTSKGVGRAGRWKSSIKTECGLHVTEPQKGPVQIIF